MPALRDLKVTASEVDAVAACNLLYFLDLQDLQTLTLRVNLSGRLFDFDEKYERLESDPEAVTTAALMRDLMRSLISQYPNLHLSLVFGLCADTAPRSLYEESWFHGLSHYLLQRMSLSPAVEVEWAEDAQALMRVDSQGNDHSFYSLPAHLHRKTAGSGDWYTYHYPGIFYSHAQALGSIYDAETHAIVKAGQEDLQAFEQNWDADVCTQ